MIQENALSTTATTPVTEPSPTPSPDTDQAVPDIEGSTPDVAPTFAELGADPTIVAALGESGIERAFPIQAMCLPLALEGRDLIGQAKTGTGKTLGFGIPLLMRLDRDRGA
jgi:superfamily II DNA/RNA helicase